MYICTGIAQDQNIDFEPFSKTLDFFLSAYDNYSMVDVRQRLWLCQVNYG